MFIGTVRCLMVDNPMGGLMPDLPAVDGLTWKRGPHGLQVPTPSAEAPECLAEIGCPTDCLAELEAHAGVLYIFEYEELEDMPNG